MYSIWRTGAVLWKATPSPTQRHFHTQTHIPVKRAKSDWENVRIQKFPGDFNS